MSTTPRLHASIVLAFVSLVFFASVRSQAPQADDALLGTWAIDLSASRYHPGPPVRSETRTYARQGDGVLGRIERVHSDGRKEVIEYRADLGHQVPVSGTRSYDAIRLKRVDAYTTEGVLSHAGRVFGFSSRVISRDGRTMTIRFRREEPGDMVDNLVVYRKK